MVTWLSSHRTTCAATSAISVIVQIALGHLELRLRRQTQHPGDDGTIWTQPHRFLAALSQGVPA